MKFKGRREAVIVDMDGTLADVTSIRHMVSGLETAKDFHAFHTASEFVPANHQAIQFCKKHHRGGRDILIVTARMERYRPETERFILRELTAPHGVSPAAQFHRADGDHRPDVEVKAEILAEIRKRWEVVAAIDDNPNVITLWQGEGIPTEVVPGWDHDEAAKYAAKANRVL